jgi:glycosyltransferase involved in cell wall biosynthesis
LQDPRNKNVTVTGTVDDLGPYYQMARVFVAPLRSGAGIKFKVAQAMLYGLPVVATRLAVEGISPPAPAGTVGAVVDDPREMARSILHFLQEEGVAEQVGAAAHVWASRTYSFQRNIEAALEHYSRATAIP